MSRWFTIISLFMLSVVSLACSHVTTMQAYPGPALASEDEAVLVVVNHREGVAAWNAVVDEVDGERAPFLFRATSTDRNFLFDAPTGAEKVIKLEPGEHRVRLGFYWNELGSGSRDETDDRCTLHFQAEPGRVYELVSEYRLDSTWDWIIRERDWSARVVDRDTAQTVSTSDCAPWQGNA
jgi:hypothetical protein